jgi:hypothetical protein
MKIVMAASKTPRTGIPGSNAPLQINSPSMRYRTDPQFKTQSSGRIRTRLRQATSVIANRA